MQSCGGRWGERWLWLAYNLNPRGLWTWTYTRTRVGLLARQSKSALACDVIPNAHIDFHLPGDSYFLWPILDVGVLWSPGSRIQVPAYQRNVSATADRGKSTLFSSGTGIFRTSLAMGQQTLGSK